MLERFTERARRVIALATEEARSRRHGAVGLEHLLIGILRDDGGFAVHVLEQLQVSPETLQAEIERRLSHLPCLPMSGEPTFSPELKAVLAAVLSAKRQLSVGPEHLLLSLLADDGSATTQILRAAGADLTKQRPFAMLARRLRTSVTAEEVSFIATSKWRVQM
jgi:ATP-dependent Clp protease ATP-binding subunit ClpC